MTPEARQKILDLLFSDEYRAQLEQLKREFLPAESTTTDKD